MKHKCHFLPLSAKQMRERGLHIPGSSAMLCQCGRLTIRPRRRGRPRDVLAYIDSAMRLS